MARSNTSFDRLAGAHVTGATGVAIVADGCATARTGAGVYTVTLDNPCAVADRIVVATVRGMGAPMTIETVDTSNTVIGVNTWNAAGAATDANFQIVVFRRT